MQELCQDPCNAGLDPWVTQARHDKVLQSALHANNAASFHDTLCSRLETPDRFQKPGMYSDQQHTFSCWDDDVHHQGKRELHQGSAVRMCVKVLDYCTVSVQQVGQGYFSEL